jgi:hypothetical protein
MFDQTKAPTRHPQAWSSVWAEDLSHLQEFSIKAMNITDPPVAPGEFKYRRLNLRHSIVNVEDKVVCTIRKGFLGSIPQMEATARLLSSSKKMAEALKAFLVADDNNQKAKDGWDDHSIEESQDRVASAIIDKVLALSNAKDILIEAGYVIEP